MISDRNVVQPAEPPENLPEQPVDSVGSNNGVSLSKRLRSPRTIISFIVALAIIIFVFRNLDLNVGEIWRNFKTGNPFYIAAAFVVYYGSFPLRAERWNRMLNQAGINQQSGYQVPGLRGLSEIYVLGWFANCLVPAKLGDAYRGYLLKKHANPSFAKTIGTIFAERVTDVSALVVLMMISVLIVFQGAFPASLQFPVAVAGLLVFLAISGLTSLFRFNHGVRRLVPTRVLPHYVRVEEGILSSFSRAGLIGIGLLTIGVWLLEGVRLFLVAAAFGVRLSPAEAIFVALLASLLTVIPLTPAGLGFVEGGTIIALKLLDVSDTNAATIALVDRGIAYWSLVVIGAALYLVSKYK